MERGNTYLSGFNGLRTIAAFCVLGNHVFMPYWDWGTSIHVNEYIPWLFEPVTTFFVISGFLMAWVLLKEQEQTGYINIGKAYRRRILRICPMYYLTFCIGIVLALIWFKPVDGLSALWIGALMPNISHSIRIGIVPLYHLWTVGVEIFFYIFFPLIVKYSRRYLLEIVIILCAGWFMLKIGSYFIFGKGLIYRLITVNKFDCMLLGSLGAILFYKQVGWWKQLMEHRWVQVIAWLLFLTSGIYANIIPSVLRSEWIAIVSLGVIMTGIVGKSILENKLTDYIGKRSYSIYLIHPLVICCISAIVRRCDGMANTPPRVDMYYLRISNSNFYRIGRLDI